MRRLVAFFTVLALAAGAPASLRSQTSAPPIKIAVINDMAGVYAANSGQGSVLAAQMAVEDFGGKVLGRPIEVVSIDHRNNAPEGTAKAREFFDQGGDLALDLPNSAVALAVSAVGKEKHKLVIVIGGGSSVLTGANCSKYTYHYAYDTYALAHSTGTNIAAQPDGKKWYMLYPNYAFGQQMLADFSAAVSAKGGTVMHADAVPLSTTDFSSYLLAAKNAHPDVLGILSAGGDTINTMKGFKQFGLDKQMRAAVGLLSITDVDALPDVFTGSRVTTSWYWDQDQPARAWADRYTRKRGGGLRPSDLHAANYSATTQWLKAVKATGSTDADKIVAYLDGRQFNDFYAHGGEWRARDHRVLHEMYVADVVPKDKLREPHGWYKIVQIIPPGRAFRPESESTCKKDW